MSSTRREERRQATNTHPTIDLIVSRHPAAVEWIAEQIKGVLVLSGTLRSPVSSVDMNDLEVVIGSVDELRRIPVTSVSTADDVRGQVVAGNVPLHLASLAKAVYAIEFAGEPPRGREYTVEAMEAAGARLVPYVVVAESQYPRLEHHLSLDGYPPTKMRDTLAARLG